MYLKTGLVLLKEGVLVPLKRVHAVDPIERGWSYCKGVGCIDKGVRLVPLKF